MTERSKKQKQRSKKIKKARQSCACLLSNPQFRVPSASEDTIQVEVGITAQNKGQG